MVAEQAGVTYKSESHPSAPFASISAPLAQGKLLMKLRVLSLVPTCGPKYSWHQSGLAQFVLLAPPPTSTFMWAPGLEEVRLVDGGAVLPESTSDAHTRCHLGYSGEPSGAPSDAPWLDCLVGAGEANDGE